MHTLHKQHGGTFVGIIIGLIIGLGIALAVAVAITKTPMPFTNKVIRSDKPEKTPDQAGDPNKPLYGNKVRPPAKETAKSDGPVDAAPPNTAVADKPKKPDAKITESKDPIRDIAIKSEAKAETKPEPKANLQAKAESTDLWTYFLQTGAFNDQGDAEASRAKLALMGVEARVTERPASNGSGVLYRVRVGPFAQLEAANRVRGKLTDNGVDATVVRVAK